MKRILMIAALVAATFAQAANTKLATQEWVVKQIRNAGILALDVTVTSNANGSVTYKSKITVPDVPQCTAVSLTFASPSLAAKTAQFKPTFLDLFANRLLAAYPDYVKKVLSLTVTSGAWYETDQAGNTVAVHPFNLGSGLALELEADLPDTPPETHTCELDDDCNCKGKDLTRDNITIPDDLKDMTATEFASEYGAWDKWITNPGSYADIASRTRNGTTTYYLQDSDGIYINLDNLGTSDAWTAGLLETLLDLNSYLNECREAYIKSQICDKTNPQHDWETTTCGSSSAKVCKNNASHTQGTLVHEFPGTSFTASAHSCKCGKTSEAHGTLVSGSKTETSTGWTVERICPKNCGYSTTYTHTHKFVDCGTCTAGDDCTTVSTGCDGKHVEVDATDGTCAKCGCTTCTDCSWHPSGDMSKHTGWEPCGEDAEEDNDWVEAKGGHCRCQCRTYGHVARTAHDYKPEPGEERYENVSDAQHYKILGKCTRCGQFRKILEEHVPSENPTSFKYGSEDICKWLYRCTKNGCDYDYVEETAHDWDDNGAVWINASSELCRKRTQCKNCKGWETDDTNGHERDTANGCKCKHGCGYQFEHSYGADACGNQYCTYCKQYESEGGDKPHKGWTETSDTQHTCACGKETGAHEYGDWEQESASLGTIHYKRTCTKCPRIERKDEPCTHTWGEWAEAGRGGGVITYTRTCSVCGQVETKTEPIPPETVCDTDNDKHYAKTDGTCGCYCGKYGPGALISSDVNFHKWADTTDANGIQICTCKCGEFHVQRTPTTYMINRRAACAGVCAYSGCGKAGSGIGIQEAPESAHTACTATDGKCGCWCGKLTAANAEDERFHPQKPGTCRCYGPDGNGGSWHFPCARTDCTKICQYGDHLASASKVKEGTVAATAADHTKTTSATCGCLCGAYSAANYASWTSVANLHNSYPYHCGCYCTHASETQISPYHKKALDTDCDCECGAKLIAHVVPTAPECYCQGKCHVDGPKHFPVADEYNRCPAVCHGNCGQATKSEYRTKHAASSEHCGCACGAWSGASCPELTFHEVAGSPECMCECGAHHNHGQGRDDCSAICKFCGDTMTYLAAKDPRTEATASQHTYPAESCKCSCGKFTDHKFATNKCTCYCGETNRAHKYKIDQNTETGTHTCSTCGNEIYEHQVIYKCSRCGETYEGYYETGHTSTCGEKTEPDTVSGAEPCPCGCGACTCYACKNRSGTCATCGNTCGDTTDDNSGVDGSNSNDNSDDPDKIK